MPNELPPLPEPDIRSHQTDSTMRTLTIHSYSIGALRAYAQAAVDAAVQASAEDARDAARWRFTMEYQDNPDRPQPDPFAVMHLKAMRERRSPTRAEYEAATDAAIDAALAAGGEHV